MAPNDAYIAASCQFQPFQLISSYTNWTSPVSASKLVSNGFKYTGQGDTVECDGCKCRLSNLKETDNIHARHSQASSNCRYVQVLKNVTNSQLPPQKFSKTENMQSRVIDWKTNNLNSSSVQTLTSSVRNQSSLLVPTQSEYRLPVPVKISGDGSFRVAVKDSKADLSDTPDGVNDFHLSEPVAKISQYQNETSRLATYEHWSDSAPVTPLMLARAGLFYTGQGDKVKCPFCLGSMYNWEQGDVPLNEHVKHYPECRFVKYKIYENLYPKSLDPALVKSAVNTGVGRPANRPASPSYVQASGPVGPRNDSHLPVENTQEKAVQQNMKFEELKVVKIVGQMGYSVKMMKQATRKIPNYNPFTLKSDMLLDALFDLESEDYCSDDEANVDSGVYASGNGLEEPLEGATAMPQENTADPATEALSVSSRTPEKYEHKPVSSLPNTVSNQVPRYPHSSERQAKSLRDEPLLSTPSPRSIGSYPVAPPVEPSVISNLEQSENLSDCPDSSSNDKPNVTEQQAKDNSSSNNKLTATEQQAKTLKKDDASASPKSAKKNGASASPKSAKQNKSHQKGHRKSSFTNVNSKVLLILGIVVITIPIISIYLGYIIGGSVGPTRNILPDSQVVVEAVKLNMSFYNSKHMTVTFSGGLGSQMFQYAALYGISKANGLKPLVTTDPNTAKINEIFPFLKAEPTKDVDPGKYYAKFREFKSNAFDQRAFSINYMRDIELVGQFQSWRYFDHVRAEIRNQFSFSKTAVGVVQEFLHQSYSKFKHILTPKLLTEGGKHPTQYIGMHVRRGDILNAHNSKQGFVPADKNYLATAMQYFKHKFNNVIFVVTSDDQDWCRNNIRTDDNLVVFSTYNHPGLDLCLLSQCNHTIITVGAFGWWGAWLAGGQTVYYSSFPKVGSTLFDEYRKTDYYLTQWWPL